ncbi:unnamed protein product [Trichobilharzia szidati]|nr:unnamed protein product [Trichobilharzia szidati]
MSRFTTDSSSLSSFQPKMLSENVYFPPLLSYSSTLAIFNELKTKLNKQSDFVQTNNALINTILPEIDYSLPHTTTTTNSNNNNTSNVTCSGSVVNDFKSFYAQPIMNRTAPSFNDRNNKSDVDSVVTFPFEKNNYDDVYTCSLNSAKSSLPPQRHCRSQQKKDPRTYEEIFSHPHPQYYPHFHHSLESQQSQYPSHSNSDDSVEMLRLCDTSTSKQFVTNTIQNHKTHYEDKMTNNKIRSTREEIKSSSTSFNGQMIGDSLKKSIQSCVSQRKRHRSIDLKTEEEEIQDHSKRYRTSYSQKQIELLEKTYQMDRYVSRPQRTKLSNELDLPENTIKVWFQNRRMKEKRQALMLPTVAGKDPYLRETLLRVTQLYCATRYGSENDPCIIKELSNNSQSKNNKDYFANMRRKVAALSTPVRETTNSTISDNYILQNSSSDTNVPKKSKLNTIQHEDLFSNPIEDINPKSMNTLKNQISTKVNDENNESDLNATVSNTNQNFIHTTEPPSNDTEGNNDDLSKWNTLSNPLNLSTSSSISSDENRALFNDDAYPRMNQKFSANTFNLFSTFPLVHTTSSSFTDNLSDSLIS